LNIKNIRLKYKDSNIRQFTKCIIKKQKKISYYSKNPKNM